MAMPQPVDLSLWLANLSTVHMMVSVYLTCMKAKQYLGHEAVVMPESLFLTCKTAKQYLGHEAVVMPQPVDLWMRVEPANGSTVHVAPHKADSYAFGLGQVLQTSYEVVSLAMMLPCSA